MVGSKSKSGLARRGRGGQRYSRGQNGSFSDKGEGYRGKKRKHRNKANTSAHYYDTNEDTEEDQNKDAPDIPGFYYDPEKKKYFKILPNHNTVTGQITKNVIKTNKIEKQRQKDLKDYAEPKPHKVISKRTQLSRQFHSSNVCHTLHYLNIGHKSPLTARMELQRNLIIKRLVRRAAQPVLYRSDGGLGQVNHVLQMVLSKDSQFVTGAWTLNGLMGGMLKYVTIKCDWKSTLGSDIKMSFPNRKFFTLTRNKVTSMCLAPPTVDDVSSTRVLMTSCSYLGEESKAEIADLVSTGSEKKTFNVGFDSVFIGAWNVNVAQFSVGTERCSTVVDVATSRMWELSSDSRPVYAQVYSQTCQQLFSGNKRGRIFTHDLRSSSTIPVVTLSHPMSVSHLYCSIDDQYLISSDVSGKIRKWDLRKQKVVLEYPGNVNEYVRIPFHVEENENFIYAAGEDCYTRFWCYNSGELLNTIPSPHPVSVAAIPIVTYTHNLGGAGGPPGLLMAIKDEFHFYSV